MRRALREAVHGALAGEQAGGLARAAAVLRDALDVDRVSVARLDEPAGSFEIAADAGAELLAPGTSLPVSTCSYFSTAAEGRSFHERDFDAAQHFRLPLDSVVLAAGFHAGCSAPILESGRPVGVVSLSTTGVRPEMDELLCELEAVAGELALATRAVASPAAPWRALVCHGDPLAGRGIARLVELSQGASTAVAPTVAAALAAAAVTPPDLVICDDWLGGVRVDEVADALRGAGVAAPMVVVATRETPEGLRACLRAGASARVLRADAVERLPAALAVVRDGRSVPLAAPADAGPALTAREVELLAGLDAGLRFKQVARGLGISEATVKTHGRNLFRKLGATSRAEAVRAARDAGLLA